MQEDNCNGGGGGGGGGHWVCMGGGGGGVQIPSCDVEMTNNYK